MRPLVVLALLAALGPCSGFSVRAPLPRGVAARALPRHGEAVAVVIDIASTDEFNDALSSAGDSLVVVDYSTSWCGPCKIIAPKFDEFSEQYKSVTFLKARRHCPLGRPRVHFLCLLPGRVALAPFRPPSLSRSRLLAWQLV
jgi:hypothetical protein